MTMLCREQDFFQLLRPGLQLLRPIKKDDVTVGREQRAGMVAYTEQRCACHLCKHDEGVIISQSMCFLSADLHAEA